MFIYVFKKIIVYLYIMCMCVICCYINTRIILQYTLGVWYIFIRASHTGNSQRCMKYSSKGGGDVSLGASVVREEGYFISLLFTNT